MKVVCVDNTPRNAFNSAGYKLPECGPVYTIRAIFVESINFRDPGAPLFYLDEIVNPPGSMTNPSLDFRRPASAPSSARTLTFPFLNASCAT
jgi:hypothetical protein